MSGDLGLLVLRVVIGLLFIGHGTQKLFGWFGGPGLAGTAGWLASTGMRPAPFWALMAGVSEAGGGLLLLAGFLNPLGALGISAAMLVAIIAVHWGKLWAAENGIELPLVYLAAANAVALVGSGAYSIDSLTGISLPMPFAWLAGSVLVILGVATALGTRKQVPQLVAVAEVDAPSHAA